MRNFSKYIIYNIMRTLELLAPAKNLECGIAAIDHGADAVYIGASRFGARAAAGNSIEDIASLCLHAHKYGAKVYVTVNTIIYEHELNDTMALVRQLAAIGVDALLVQDMGLAKLCRGIIPLHASTQCDTRTKEKALWLRDMAWSEWCWHANCLRKKFAPSTMPTLNCSSRCLFMEHCALAILACAMLRNIVSTVVPTVASVLSSAE